MSKMQKATATRHKTSIKVMFYNIAIVMALVFHAFQTEIGSFKLFYIFSLLAVAGSLLLLKNEKNTLIAIAFISITLIRGFLSFDNEIIDYSIRVTIVFLSACSLQRVDKNFSNMILTVFSFFFMIASLFKSRSDSYYRFTGFYSDPNYLCFCIYLLIYICLSDYDKMKKQYKVLSLITCLIALYITLITISRTGIVVNFASVFIFFFVIQKKKLIYLFLAITLLFVLYANNKEAYWSIYDLVNSRIETRENDTLEGGFTRRLQLSFDNLSDQTHKPLDLLFGSGISTTLQKNYSVLKIDNRDHNTFTSVLSEQGLICFMLLLMFLYNKFKLIMTQSSKPVYEITFFVGCILYMMSVWTEYFLPFWFFLFYCPATLKAPKYLLISTNQEEESLSPSTTTQLAEQ